MTTAWSQVNEATLFQGDYLPRCLVPIIPASFFVQLGMVSNQPLSEAQGEQDIEIPEYDVIIMTQSCDLENGKVQQVVVCPCFPVHKWREVNPSLAKRDKLNEIKKGRYWGLTMLPAFDDVSNTEEALVVDLRVIHTLPFAYLVNHAQRIGPRWRLESPYIEGLAQTFGMLFMRVAYPFPLPNF